MNTIRIAKAWSKRQLQKAEGLLSSKLQGSLEEITGRGWIFVVVVVGIVMVFGPQVYHLVHNNVSSSVSTVSSNFNFQDYTG